MHIGNRVREKRIQLGLTQTELAKRVGITQQSLQKIENGRTHNPRKLLSLSKALNCLPEWLQFGSISDFHEKSRLSHDQNEPTLINKPVKQLPILDYMQAAVWNDKSVRSQEQKYIKEWEIGSNAVGDNAFWVRVIGDSMTSPVGISIPENFLILVDPSSVAKSGDLIIAKHDASDQVTFKKLIIDLGLKYLIPLNTNYRSVELNKNCQIIGVVKEAKMKF